MTYIHTHREGWRHGRCRCAGIGVVWAMAGYVGAGQYIRIVLCYDYGYACSVDARLHVRTCTPKRVTAVQAVRGGVRPTVGVVGVGLLVTATATGCRVLVLVLETRHRTLVVSYVCGPNKLPHAWSLGITVLCLVCCRLAGSRSRWVAKHLLDGHSLGSAWGRRREYGTIPLSAALGCRLPGVRKRLSGVSTSWSRGQLRVEIGDWRIGDWGPGGGGGKGKSPRVRKSGS